MPVEVPRRGQPVPAAPPARWRLAADGREAARCAEELGYPAVVKAIVPNLVHKSDLDFPRPAGRGRTASTP